MARSPQTSVRFDPEKLELIKKQENLTTPQKVVDFLIDQYWWKWRLNATSKELDKSTEIDGKNGEL